MAGVSEMLQSQCVGDSILMRPMLDLLTASLRAFFVKQPTQQPALTRADTEGNSNQIIADCHVGRLSAL